MSDPLTTRVIDADGTLRLHTEFLLAEDVPSGTEIDLATFRAQLDAATAAMPGMTPTIALISCSYIDDTVETSVLVTGMRDLTTEEADAHRGGRTLIA